MVDELQVYGFFVSTRPLQTGVLLLDTVTIKDTEAMSFLSSASVADAISLSVSV